jgi:hypothetical protein
MFSRPIQHQWNLASDQGHLHRGESQWFAPPDPKVAYDPFVKDITMMVAPEPPGGQTKVVRTPGMSNADLSTTIFAA